MPILKLHSQMSTYHLLLLLDSFLSTSANIIVVHTQILLPANEMVSVSESKPACLSLASLYLKKKNNINKEAIKF